MFFVQTIYSYIPLHWLIDDSLNIQFTEDTWKNYFESDRFLAFDLANANINIRPVLIKPSQLHNMSMKYNGFRFRQAINHGKWEKNHYQNSTRGRFKNT